MCSLSRLCLWMLALEGSLITMAAADASVLPLHVDEVTVTADRPLAIGLTPPEDWPHVFLALEGRLVNPAASWRGGSMPCIRYEVNGKVLDLPRMVSLRDPSDVMSWDGEAYSWIGEGENWRLPYSPDFRREIIGSHPSELGENPYLQVFDITDLAPPGQDSELAIHHAMPHYESLKMVFQQVRLLSAYERPVAAVPPRDLPTVSDQPVGPQRRHEVGYRARLLPGGGIEVKVAGEAYVVGSRFSMPGGGMSRLGEEPTEWLQEAGGGRLVARCDAYRLERTLTCHAERIEVRDRLTDLTGERLGVRLAHEIDTPRDRLRKVYMCGRRLPRMEGRTSVDVHPLENPTVYICGAGAGVGLLPRDTVFRAHVEMRLRDGAWGLHDRHLAIGAGDTHEVRWEIYPTESADHFSFVNAARRALNANYLIDGNMVIAHGYEGAMVGLSDDDLVRLVRANNARYVILSTISRLDEQGLRLPPRGLHGYCHGSALMSEHGRWNRQWLLKVMTRFRRLVPDVKLLPYIDPFVCSQPGASDEYSDSAAIARDGQPQLYTDARMPVFYPTLENSYGKALGAAFDWLMEHSDGFYMDESTMYHHPVSGAFGYRSGGWDGHSCEMDLGQGEDEAGATYRILRPLVSSALKTLPFRLEQLQKARRQGKAIWMNFQPLAEEEVALQTYRFVECYSNTAPVYSYLGCPTSLANEHVERTERDIGRSIHRMLQSGGLYLTYGIKYQTSGNIMQDLYPITPMELHCGYVIGAEKIVTCVSGRYGFGDGSGMRLRVYDRAGFHLPDRDAAVPANSAGTLMQAELAEGEMAIVFRQ